jgi:predicted ArsR family transcriptional regulator
MPPEPIDSRSHRVLAGVSRVAVLEVLRVSTVPLDAQAIAKKVGLHANTVRSHLDQLLDAGLVESSAQQRATPGRPRLVFRATATSAAGPQDSYKLLAEILVNGIDGGTPAPGELATEAGRQWGHQVTQHADPGTGVDAARALDRIVALLDDLGFAPTIRETTRSASAADVPGAVTVIELHRCPFYDVAREHGAVVCGVHLGLLQGAVEQMQSPPATIRLEPFVRPDLCLVHIAPSGVGPRSRERATT